MHFYGEQPRDRAAPRVPRRRAVPARRPAGVVTGARRSASAPASSEARSGSRWPARGHEVVGFDRDARTRSRARRSWARSTTVAPDRRGRGARRRRRDRRGAGRSRSPRWWSQALDAGAPVVTDVGSVKGPVVAEVERGTARRARRGSSAATRWPVPSRTVSTAPTPTCSSARPGCSRRPPTTDATRTRPCAGCVRDLGAEVVAVDARASRRARRARESRAAARGDHADGRRDDARRGAPRRCCGSRPAGSAT